MLCQVTVVWLLAASGVPLSGATQAIRTISFDRQRTIASQIQQGDGTVTVVKHGPPPGRSVHVPTLDERVAAFRRADAVLRVRPSRIDGVVTPDGTWIWTQVEATATQVGRVADTALLPDPATIEFWHRDGTAMINGATVRAGAWPLLEPQRDYLVSLAYDDLRLQFTVVFALSVDDQDRLSHVSMSDGSWFSPVDVFKEISATELLRRIADAP